MKSNPTIVAELFNYSVPTENILSNSVSFFQPTSLPPTHIPSASPTVQNIDHHVHDYSGEVVFRPSESGLGNNLLGLTSAFIIATVTNKKLSSRNYAYDVAFKVTDYWNTTVEHGSSKC
ncbi:hypothetical protein WA171_000286 [Blastocystis sp. BT1]